MSGRPLLPLRRGASSKAVGKLLAHPPHADASPLTQLDAALVSAFHRLDKSIRATMPDGTTAGVVLLKRAPNGASRLAPCSSLAALFCAFVLLSF